VSEAYVYLQSITSGLFAEGELSYVEVRQIFRWESWGDVMAYVIAFVVQQPKVSFRHTLSHTKHNQMVSNPVGVMITYQLRACLWAMDALDQMPATQAPMLNVIVICLYVVTGVVGIVINVHTTLRLLFSICLSVSAMQWHAANASVDSLLFFWGVNSPGDSEPGGEDQ